jgi:1-acyl-sn-glycerol-3-phosphate acyltransferase
MTIVSQIDRLSFPCPRSAMPSTFAARAFKRFALATIGAGTFWHLGLRNKLVVSGREHLRDLPRENVLFVANHQTWFLDVIAIYHALTRDRASLLSGLRAPLNVSFIAAHETMERRGLLPKFLAVGGAVCVRRTWREGEQQISRPVEPSDLSAIEAALRSGWVFTFPQGTTRPGAPGRKGTAHLICGQRPVVVPVVIDGFRAAFDKTGLKVQQPGSALSVRFKAPLAIAHDASLEAVLAQVMDAIEQPHHPDIDARAGQLSPLAARAAPRRAPEREDPVAPPDLERPSEEFAGLAPIP